MNNDMNNDAENNQNYNTEFNELNILNNIDLNNSEELEKYFCSDLDYSSFEDIENHEALISDNKQISFKNFKKQSL